MYQMLEMLHLLGSFYVKVHVTNDLPAVNLCAVKYLQVNMSIMKQEQVMLIYSFTLWSVVCISEGQKSNIYT